MKRKNFRWFLSDLRHDISTKWFYFKKNLSEIRNGPDYFAQDIQEALAPRKIRK